MTSTNNYVKSSPGCDALPCPCAVTPAVPTTWSNPRLVPALIRQRIKHHSRRHFATAAVLLVAVSLGGIDGIDGLQAEYWSGAGCNLYMVSPADQPTMYRLRF